MGHAIHILSLYDYLAVAWFLTAWFGFNLLVDVSPWRKKTLSYAMDTYRRNWMRTMAGREVRIMDTAIMTGLQQGTAFFASTSLIAIGGSFTLLDSTDIIQQLAGDLSIPVDQSRAVWEVKVLGLTLIMAYAFFKFGWAYRLFNYSSIIIGSVQEINQADRQDICDTADRAGELNVLAGVHFNRGQRAFFFGIAFLAWFAGPLAFALTTLAVLLVLLRRQFASKSLRAVTRDSGPVKLL